MPLVPDPTPASGLASGRPLTAMPGSLRGLLATSAARAAESRAAMLHACARRGSGTRLRLLPRAVLMGVGPNSTPSSAQVTAKPQSSCAIVASEALASPRPPPRVMKGQGWGLHAHPPWRSGTASWLLPRSVLMGIGPNSTPSSAQVMAKPESSCVVVTSEALASPRPPPTVMKGQG